MADLSLAYSPGVASPCLAIEKDREAVYDYTGKGNLVGVISNGSAVLGLGGISGRWRGKPVMEGKAMLFKKFAGVDAFDIEINSPTAEGFIETRWRIFRRLLGRLILRIFVRRSAFLSSIGCGGGWIFRLCTMTSMGRRW